MGPPLSPRETRRSGRRSLPSASASTSKSPDSDAPPKQKDSSHRPPLTSNNSATGRQKRPKQEDTEDPADERKNGSAPPTTTTANPQASGRAKRKPKDKEKQLVLEAVPASEAPPDPAEPSIANVPEDEEEQGITRCVCGSTGDDDPDAGEFMVQCETCKVWQHGLCMGFESEDQLHDDDYYCEQCRPELHTELFRKRSKRARHPSTSHHNPASAARVSRSHSPSTLSKQPSKRRNTMNSRDAAFDESLKEIIEATAAEAAAAHDAVSVTSAGNRDGHQAVDDEVDPGPSNRRKRKRAEDDVTAKKRTRSASATSEHPGSTAARDTTPSQTKTPSLSAPLSKPSGRANKRGARKTAAPLALDLHALENEDTVKRPGNSSRAKNLNPPKRPPASASAVHATSDHVSRRNPTIVTTGHNASSTASESSRAYRNSHAYAVSQQSLYTSWNLPDYLAHLEPMLPTNTPRPLEVRSGVSDSIDLTVERGVKVRWPSKRMSVGDMNKRVRSLVEWVGREQATALDRMRRRDALSGALQEQTRSGGKDKERGDESIGSAMISDGTSDQGNGGDGGKVGGGGHEPNDVQSSATMKLMEELMEELIGFQERFGPGAARSRERERRLA